MAAAPAGGPLRCAARTNADTVVVLRDSDTSEMCVVRRSGSLLLQHLQDELCVSTLLECDERGNALPRGVTLSRPSEVLRSGRTYIAARDHRERVQMQQQAALQRRHLGQSFAPSPGVVIKPTVTFNNAVEVTEYVLPSPAQSGSNQSFTMATSSVATPGQQTAAGGGRSLLIGSELSFASAVLDPSVPRASMPLTSSASSFGALRAPAAAAPARIHYELDGAMRSASWSDVEQLAARDFDAEALELNREADDIIRRNFAAMDAYDAATAIPVIG
jgi:hypothetical protein